MSPRDVVGLPGPAVSISMCTHTCAALADGTVWCWGHNYCGLLGDGTETDSVTPLKVEGVAGVIAVSAGVVSCALRDIGTVYCWGCSSYGALGNGESSGARRGPARVEGLDDVVEISVGAWDHACARRANGEIWCWGAYDHDEYQGQLGHGPAANGSTVPVQVVGLGPARSVSVGTRHACAALEDGTAWCWGSDSNTGQLGTNNPDLDIAYAPVQVVWP